MNNWKRSVLLFLMICGTCFFPRVTWADIFVTAVDTSHKKIKKVSRVEKKDGGEEVILDEIQIKGKVDKPGVIILPKRIEPELGEVELERSFKKEVKEGIGEIQRPDETIGRIENVESIKKAVQRKRQ